MARLGCLSSERSDSTTKYLLRISNGKFPDSIRKHFFSEAEFSPNVFVSLQDERAESEEEAEGDVDLDGVPLSPGAGAGAAVADDIDGVPLDGAPILKGAMKGLGQYNDDLDGVPIDDDLDGVPMDDNQGGDRNPSKSDGRAMPAGFVPSRWETVDPEQVEAQAMTTSKWDQLDQQGTVLSKSKVTLSGFTYDLDMKL